MIFLLDDLFNIDDRVSLLRDYETSRNKKNFERAPACLKAV